MVFDMTEYEGHPNVRPIPQPCVLSLNNLNARQEDEGAVERERCVGIAVASDDNTLLNDIIVQEAQRHPDYWIKFCLVARRATKNCGHSSPIINPRMSVQPLAAHLREGADHSDTDHVPDIHAMLRSLAAKQGFRPRTIEIRYMAIY